MDGNDEDSEVISIEDEDSQEDTDSPFPSALDRKVDVIFDPVTELDTGQVTAMLNKWLFDQEDKMLDLQGGHTKISEGGDTSKRIGLHNYTYGNMPNIEKSALINFTEPDPLCKPIFKGAVQVSPIHAVRCWDPKDKDLMTPLFLR